MNMTTAEAEINGINLHYRVYGEGEPLLLIMGLSGNADWWDPRLLKTLSERFQVATFDNRGAGRSGKPKGPYTIAQMASDTVGLMDYLGWNSADVLGMSMGGMIAQELALDYPERVKRLVLVCTNCGGREQVLASPEVYALLTMPREGLSQEDIVRASLYLLFPKQFIEENPDKMEEAVASYMAAPIPPECFVSQLNAANTWSCHPRLGGLGHPTLIIHGDQDILIPPENAPVLAGAIPDSRVVLIPGAAHGVTSMYPEEVAREVLDFLT
jgi:pimeloyl-ACP methyl ester carboxylesterase